MANRLSKFASISFTPAVPGIPGEPGRWVTDSRPIYRAASDINYAYSLALQIYSSAALSSYRLDSNSQNPRTRQAASFLLGSIVSALIGSGPTAGGGLGKVIGVKEKKVYIPGTKGTPGKPAVYSHNPQSGWNGGARSIRRIIGDGHVEFQLGPRNIGAIVGLSGPVDTRNFGEATHAFYQAQNTVFIVERGVSIASVSVDVSSRPVFKITRLNGVVTYEAGTFKYTSPSSSYGDVYLDALLYTADDYVDNPLIKTVQHVKATGQLSLVAAIDPRPRATTSLVLSGHAILRADGVVSLRVSDQVSLGGYASGSTQNAGAALTDIELGGHVLPTESKSIVRRSVGRVISSEETYSRSVAVFAGVGMYSRGGEPILVTSSSAAAYCPRFVNSVGITGGVGESTAKAKMKAYSVDAELAYGNVNWGKSRAVKEGAFLVATGADPYSPLEFVLNEALLFLDERYVANELNVSLGEWISLSDECIAEVSEDAQYAEILIFGDDASILFDLDLTLSERLYISDRNFTGTTGGLQIGVNLTTGASGTYRGFDFLRIINTDSGSYGVRSDGVYRIVSGVGDDGVAFGAEIDFGVMDFGRATTSRIENVFVGCSTDGQMYAKLTADEGVERTYRVVKRDPVSRADPARGATGRAWRLKLQLVESTSAEIDLVEVVTPASVSRRAIGRGRK